MRSALWVGLLSGYIALLTSCQPFSEVPDHRGRLLVWHAFESTEADALVEVLDLYTDLHPGVVIVPESVSTDVIVEQFLADVKSSLGPDMLIIPYDLLPPLIQAGALKNLTSYGLDLSNFMAISVDHVVYQQQLYGLPLALGTQVLCYDKTIVLDPPETLDDLSSKLESGQQLGLVSTLFSNIWGVAAFEGRVLDDAGRIILDQGGFSEWLDWLRQARTDTNVIFSDDAATLQAALVERQLTYYVCESREIPELKSRMGEERFGITLLPGNPGLPAGPPIGTQVMTLNQVSTEAAIDLSIQLAQFLTNTQQQSRLLNQTESLIPVNVSVEIDQRLSPIEAILFRQSWDGLSIPLEHIDQAFTAGKIYGDEYYNLVLEGVLDPEQAAIELTQRVNQEYGLNPN